MIFCRVHSECICIYNGITRTFTLVAAAWKSITRVYVSTTDLTGLLFRLASGSREGPEYVTMTRISPFRLDTCNRSETALIIVTWISPFMPEIGSRGQSVELCLDERGSPNKSEDVHEHILITTSTCRLEQHADGGQRPVERLALFSDHHSLHCPGVQDHPAQPDDLNAGITSVLSLPA